MHFEFSNYQPFIYVCLGSTILCYVLWRTLIREHKQSNPKIQTLSTAEKTAAARQRLIGAVGGDVAAADRLIAREHHLAGKIGCGKLAAVERALIKLERDRSTPNIRIIYIM